MKSGQDTKVAGANLEGNKVDIDVGGDLTVASLQDTSESKSSNWSIGGTATVGAGAAIVSEVGIDADSETGDSANIGFGKNKSSSAWVNKQTSIIGKEEVDIYVENNTHVEGAVIAAENGNLKLNTNTLTYNDINDHDTSEGYQVGFSGSKSAENAKDDERRDGKDANGDTGNPYSGTVDGSYNSKDRRQINRATIGEGEIVIRSDPDAGLEGLNRDLAKAQEITKDEKTSVTVYVDTSAIKEIASGFKGVQANAKKMATRVSDVIADLKGKDQLSPAEMIWAKEEILKSLKDAKVFGSEKWGEHAGKKITDDIANAYNSLREQGLSNSEALTQIENSFQALGEWADKINKDGLAITTNSLGKLEFNLPTSKLYRNVLLGVDDAAFGASILLTGAAIAVVAAADPELAAKMADTVYNSFQKATEWTSDIFGQGVDYVRNNLTKETMNTILVKYNKSYALLTGQSIATVSYGDGITHETAVKGVMVGGQRMVYDTSTGLFYGQKAYYAGLLIADKSLSRMTLSPADLDEFIEGYPAEPEVKQGLLETFPIHESDAEIHIFVPANQNADDYILTYPDSSGEKVVTTETYPDMSGQKDFLDYVLNNVQYRKPPKEYKRDNGIPGIDENITHLGSKGGRQTWVTKNRIYQWDSQHAQLETFTRGSKEHLGETDPKTGELNAKKAKKDRKPHGM